MTATCAGTSTSIPDDVSAVWAVKFIRFQVPTGSIGGRSGTAVMQHDGIFVGGVARSTWSFVEGSGTGELINLHGSGSYESVDQVTVNSTFVYSFGET